MTTYAKPPAVPVRHQLKWAAVDLDGTLAQGLWTPDDPTSEIGPPIPANVEKLRQLVNLGFKVVIHTSRPWNDYEAIEAWLVFYQLPFHHIICGKLLADRYIDDRAVNADDPVWATEARV